MRSTSTRTECLPSGGETRFPNLLLNTASNFASQGGQALYFFFITPLVVAAVGAEDYGIWATGLSTIGFLGFLDMGLAMAVIKYVGRCEGTSDNLERNRWVSSVLAAYLVLGSLALAVAVGLGLLAPNLFNLPAHKHHLATLVFVLLGVRVALSLPLSVSKGVLVGSQRAYLANAGSLVSLLVSAGGIVLALRAGLGLIGVAAAYVCSMVVMGAIQTTLAFLRVPGLRVRPALFDRGRLFRALSFSGYSFLITVSSFVMHRADAIVIQIFCQASDVAIYYVALRLAEVVILLTKPLVNAISPFVPALAARGEQGQLRLVLLRGSKFSLLLAAPAILLGFVIGERVFSLWLGSSFAASGTLLRLLLVGIVATILQSNVSNVLNLAGQHRFLGRAMLLQTLVNIGLSLLLVQTHGPAGVAFATVVTVVLVDLLLVVRVGLKRHTIGALEYLRVVVLPALLAIAAPTLLLLLLDHWLTLRSAGDLLSVSALVGLVYLTGVWYLALDDAEQELVRRRLAGRKAA
jgi:O-antigen/teichoic acid export membrane protein